MERLAMIERWLQQQDDELLYDVDGGAPVEEDPWIQHGGDAEAGPWGFGHLDMPPPPTRSI